MPPRFTSHFWLSSFSMFCFSCSIHTLLLCPDYSKWWVIWTFCIVWIASWISHLNSMNIGHRLMKYIHSRLPDARHPCLHSEIQMSIEWPHGAILSRRLVEMCVQSTKKHWDWRYWLWRILAMTVEVLEVYKITKEENGIWEVKRTKENLDYIWDKQSVRSL